MANALRTVSANPAQNNRDGYKVWADVNSVTIMGRVFHVEKLESNYGEYLAFTIITNTVDDDAVGMNVRFNSDDKGLMKMFDGGYIPNGRRITVIGQIKEVRNSYTNNDGVVVALKRPELSLIRVNAQLGASPKAK